MTAQSSLLTQTSNTVSEDISIAISQVSQASLMFGSFDEDALLLLLHKEIHAREKSQKARKATNLADFESLVCDNICKIDDQDASGRTALGLAMSYYLRGEAQILIRHGADVTISDCFGCHPLYLTGVGEDCELATILLNKGANIDAAQNDGDTLLARACRMGHLDLVNLLLERQVNINVSDEKCWTPLHWACMGANLKIVERLLEVHATNINAIEIRHGWTPLMAAVCRGLEKAVVLLLEKKPNLYMLTSQQWTPLMAATEMRRERVVGMILSHIIGWEEGYLEMPDQRGWTPLHVASSKGLYKIVSQLISAGANCDATNNEGTTPLHFASSVGPEEERNPVLVILDTMRSTGHTRWNEGTLSGRCSAVVELLLLNGADPSIKNDNGETALHNAAGVDDADKIGLLLQHMRSDDYRWEDWKESPVSSALRGAQPKIAMEALLSKTDIKEAPFWRDDGRVQVISEAAKSAKSLDVVGMIFRELPGETENPPDGSDNWGPIQWAAHERLPDVLSELIGKFGRAEHVDKMIDEALQATSKSIQRKELESESLCERLVQVMWNLITTSQRTPKNTEAVKEAWSIFYDMMRMDLWLRQDCHNRSSKPPRWRRDPRFLKAHAELVEAQDSMYRVEWEMIERLETCYAKHLESNSSKTVEIPDMLSTLQDILKDPPFAQISQSHKDEVDYKPPMPDPNHKEIVEKAEATVVGFFKDKYESGRIRRNRPIQEIVYDPGPTDVIGKAIRNLIDVTDKGSMRFNSKLYAKKNLKLIWVHLPSTNDLLTTIMSYERYRTRDYYEVRSFLRDSWVEVPDKESRSRMMRPRSVIRSMDNMIDCWLEKSKTSDSLEDDAKGKQEADRGGSEGREESDKNSPRVEDRVADVDEDEQKIYNDWNSKSLQPAKRPHGFVPASAIYMPYLSYSTHCRHWDGRLVPGNRALKEAHEQYDELQDKYKGKDKQQHGLPTLDEWYYQFAQEDDEAVNDQNSRNESQVVSKYLKENEGRSESEDPNQWTVVRVNQLWIWTISQDWIITATSSPFTSSPDTLVDEILNQLSKQAEYGGSRAQSVSAAELIPVIIDHCIGSYERRPPDSGHISIGQTFSHYINRIGRKETSLFDDFRAWSPEEHQKKKVKNKHSRNPLPHNLLHATSGRTAETHSQDISAAIKKAKNLYCDIKDVRDEHNILKSVAQYQQIVQRGLAGKEVDESWFSSTYVVKDLKELDSIAQRIQSAQSEVANRQATEATRQGKTVMTFTFATVLFLPLSFLSSLFALDVTSFQEAPAWAFYVIFFVSMGIPAILGFSVFYWDNIKHVKHKLVNGAANELKDRAQPASGSLDMPKTSNSGNDETEKGRGPLSALKQMEARDPGVMSRFRGQRRNNETVDLENRGARG
ncbi:ankyrin [Fusarium phyllophilum]|uniref:Ankyrin n=1 Tax=Fusarium phyllophilum TaxID=47803 RepID=A0A8H5KBN1_9HYPO|nr:ankyrin [Fusarium phyllophilum]